MNILQAKQLLALRFGRPAEPKRAAVFAAVETILVALMLLDDYI